MNNKKTPQEKNPDVIEEPKPGPNHLFCAICREQFKDYISHIFSSGHKSNVRTGQNSMIYSEIDKAILDVNNISKNKEIHRSQMLLKNRRKQLQREYLDQLSVNNPEEKQANFQTDLTSGNSNKSTTIDSSEVHVAQDPLLPKVMVVKQPQQTEQCLVINLDDDDDESNGVNTNGPEEPTKNGKQQPPLQQESMVKSTLGKREAKALEKGLS